MLWPYAVLTFVTLVLFKLSLTVAAIVALAATLGYFLSDLRRIPRRIIIVCAAGVIAGALLFALRLPLLKPEIAPPESGTATVTGVSRKSVTVLTESGGKIRLTGIKREELPPKYARINFTCTLQEMPNSSFSTFERLSGVRAWCRVVNLKVVTKPEGKLADFRKRTLDFLYGKFARVASDEPGKRSLIAAFLLGDTDELTAEELDAFRDMGLMHLFAVSGLNIALLFGLIYLPFRFAGLPGFGSALGYAVATGFLLLLDFPVPLLRAWLFMTIGLAMRLIDRRITSSALLFLTAVVVELLFPLSTFTISFILSFGITAAILIFYEPILFCFAARNKIRNFIASHAALTLAAGLPAMVLSFFLFGSANPLSLMYNLLLVPFSGLYLFASLIYLAFEPARYIIIGLDQLYLRFAAWHSNYVSAYFPLANKNMQLAAMVAVLAILAMLYVLSERDRLWSARRNLRYAVPLIAIILILPYVFMAYPTTAFYAVPNKVWMYNERQITFTGAQIFTDGKSTEPRYCFPVTGKNEYARPRGLPPEILINGKHCFVFTGRMRPENWAPNILERCTSLHVFQSKTMHTSSSEWDELFRLFGYRGRVEIRKFFTWYGDRTGSCVRESL